MAFVHQTSFAAGELSPELWSRVDQAIYYIGLRTCANFIVRQYGGVSNRPGTMFTAESKVNGRKMTLIPFSFNEQQTYAIEVGHQYMRIIKDGGEVLEDAFTITDVTQADPGVVTTSSAHGYSNGDDVYITGIEGMLQLNGRNFRVANVTSTTFELTDYDGNDIDTSGYAAYSSAGTVARVYTVTTPWEEDDLFDINYAQSNDVITLVHPDYYPQDVTRTDHDAWTVEDFEVENGPFRDINVTSTTVYANAVSGTVTLTASSSIFDSSMVDELFYIEQEPANDDVKRWDVDVGINDGEIRRAEEHYYQAPSNGYSASISGVVGATPRGIVDFSSHTFQTGDIMYVTGCLREQLNNKFFTVLRDSSTRIYIEDILGNAFATNAWANVAAGGSAAKAFKTGTVKPIHTEGKSRDGDPGILWEYLHSGYGIVKITAVASGTSATATVIRRLPESCVGSGNATTLWAKQSWSESQGYPGACAYHKQRMVFAGTLNEPNYTWFSGVKRRNFYGINKPALDDDAITAALDTTKATAVRHLVPLKNLIALTSSSEQVITGVDGQLLATEPLQTDVQGYTGSSKVPPIIIGNTGIFVQEQGNVVRSLEYDLARDSFAGIDLSARSPHMFERKTIVDWAYQRHPFSVIWAVMSDGTMNAFTYMREQEVYAWHRHSTLGGEIESVCSIREGQESAVYFVVKRTINGVTKRYVERLANREVALIQDAFFVDSGLTYDGRNYYEDETGITSYKTATTITITGGTDWDAPEELTLTASASLFRSTDVGDRIVFEDGNVFYNLDITAYSSNTVVTAVPSKALPAAYQGAARQDWIMARKTIGPLHHLEGETVMALVNGNVEGEDDELTVSDGLVTLGSHAAVAHIGKQIVSDLETLAIDTPPGKIKLENFVIPRVFVNVKESRGLKAGANALEQFDVLTEVTQRNTENGYDGPIQPQTRVFEVPTESGYEREGRVFIRHDIPTPLTILSITPDLESGND